MAKDLYHIAVRNALVKDGWTITDDPFRIQDKDQNIDYEVDLGAEKIFTAEKGNEKVAIEVKSFLKTSIVNEFHGVLGQYITYSDALELLALEQDLILAIPEYAFIRLQGYPFILHLIEKHNVKFLVYDENEQIIVLWKK